MAQDSDEAAMTAWKERMLALRDGCRAAIGALHTAESLAPEWTPETATDTLWTMLLVPNWENLTIERGCSTKKYIRWMKTLAKRSFVEEST